MAPKRGSPSATPERDEENITLGTGQESTLSDEVWNGMQDVLTHIYDFRTADEHDPSKIFHRKVNKRAIPGYYDVIKEPMALSTIKSKVNAREYASVEDFVRDFALIPHNAFVYNLPDSGAYQDAVTIKEQLEEQLQKLARAHIITEKQAQLPYLGEIPAADEIAVEEEEDEEEEEEDDEEDESEKEEVEEVPKKRGRGRPRKSSVIKREAAAAAAAKEEKADDPETRKKRGRPPKVLTPIEHRIQTVLKGIRKPKNSDGQALILNFERLPDKQAMPEYYRQINNPVAYDVLKRKYKRKKYSSLDAFMKDVSLMFENAKQYNEDDSEIYKDAVTLQAEAHRLAEEVKAIPDTEYVGDEGRIPMPEGILHNGELYKIGDWVFIQNANDLTKPIPTQIYRTYQDAQGGKWVNVCWYYRPEQTVHRFDKHFYENEISKTGQYRDHRIDEIVGRCFIMFVTRYFKGRPVNIPPDTEVFVCDARYNEEKFTFNKIKTWASCLPDEVRDKDYAMDQFAAPRRMKKYPSPIAYLLKDDQKETDDIPKPEWGADNAPPKIGAVHRRSRDPKDSPPPEPTPPPPPTPPPVPVQRAPEPAARPSYSPAPPTIPTANMSSQQSPVRPSSSQRQSYSGLLPQQYQQTASPSPNIQARPYQGQQYPPHTPSTIPDQSQQLRTAQSQQPQAQLQSGVVPSNPYLRADAASYRGPPPIEVYTLPEAANYSIPVEIRSLFQRDEADRVLFFTAPPSFSEDETLKPLHLSKTSSSTSENVNLGHSARYLAAKARRAEELARKKADYEREKEGQHELQRKRKANDRRISQQEVERLKRRAVQQLQDSLGQSMAGDIRAMYGRDWEREVGRRVEEVGSVNTQAQKKATAIEDVKRERAAKSEVSFAFLSSILDEN
ncbi:Bromodomain-containing protein [Myriangium duriaei CBS 260.36]|uniref:Bromodomain-containing protein n=1 Tax=Myriangium duriaei CBS 260.36 TaxID=1168546 RepID=A0A9P4MD58_9PEZI|nr:Bromodomain-containing protein [Myriangium duriaei CBS 260.36]